MRRRSPDRSSSPLWTRTLQARTSSPGLLRSPPQSRSRCPRATTRASKFQRARRACSRRRRKSLTPNPASTQVPTRVPTRAQSPLRPRGWRPAGHRSPAMPSPAAVSRWIGPWRPWASRRRERRRPATRTGCPRRRARRTGPPKAARGSRRARRPSGARRRSRSREARRAWRRERSRWESPA